MAVKSKVASIKKWKLAFQKIASPTRVSEVMRHAAVLYLMEKLKAKKSLGPGGIPKRIFQELKGEIVALPENWKVQTAEEITDYLT